LHETNVALCKLAKVNAMIDEVKQKQMALEYGGMLAYQAVSKPRSIKWRAKVAKAQLLAERSDESEEVSDIDFLDRSQRC